MKHAICSKCKVDTMMYHVIRTEVAYYCINCFDKHNIDILEKPPTSIQLTLFD